MQTEFDLAHKACWGPTLFSRQFENLWLLNKTIDKYYIL